ncbi:hypothetical protein SCP_0115580 [Sparassis crispa]|uniref:CxC1-like cysteine cluster associated with KDZ transposases domain-containing protein n=1 Tax=Sparassis crispa TaxID=139825 RepID=A0A401G934_9APHY|nr:hypothetical protein SCP_0115580 [Sparassis crispa]GBE78667.1 hypothetical protein SCP_0115580 [Sparassis crispa]
MSRSVHVASLVISGRSSSRHAKHHREAVYGAKAIAREQQRAEERYRLAVTGLGAQSLQALSDIREDDIPMGDVSAPDNPFANTGEAEGAGAPNTGHDPSSARPQDGMEWEDIPEVLQGDASFVHAVRDIVGSEWKARWYKDARTWCQRMHRMDENWQPLIPDLIDAYLTWKYAPEQPPNVPATTDDPSPYDFMINVMDFYSLASSATISRAEDSRSMAHALVLNGYLETSPVFPSMAISLKTLELLRSLRLVKASFSIEAFGEPPRRWSCMFCMDGNNLLKWIAQVGNHIRGDTRVFVNSDYYLSQEFVDKYVDEVPPRQTSSTPSNGDDLEEHGQEDDINCGDPEGGDPTDGAFSDIIIPCMENWKAAAADEKKRMWGIFEETGIFASACPHGFILWLIDMVRSGELAKYPLTTIAKALEVLSDKTLAGYDISCIFEDTIQRSSLGPEWQWRRCRCCVNAFHGYSHNYLCQLTNHPNIIEGMGLEDLETMERIFSASNNLAAITRYASGFRQRLFIDAFFHQWDIEKYANLSTMLFNNYVQALKIIKEDGAALEEAIAALQIMHEDLAKWSHEEREYFKSLGEEPEWDIHAMAYVKSLQELRTITAHLENTSTQFLATTPNDYIFMEPTSGRVAYNVDVSWTRKLETNKHYLSKHQAKVHHDVIVIEVKMGIARRWQPTDDEYITTVKYISTRKYHHALDNLQHLIVHPYRVRTHIAKSLQVRCKAIRNAVKVYNAAANALVPPRPTPDWTKVSHYSFIDEFHILKDTRNDVRQKEWTRPAVQEAMKQARRIAQAHVELERCNVEVRCLHTSIRNEELQFTAVINQLKEQQASICGARLYTLNGFTGAPSPGQRKGSAIMAPPLASSSLAPDLDDDVDPEVEEEEEDELQGDIGGIVDYMCNLTV